ncbi:MAG TPA: septum formation protein Maf [Mizugakiibacter sp.]|nr:septum formation protein Maf [Mizugakiibacter sp.]
MNRPPVILASTSPYRAELLRRILPQFEQCAPAVDESPLANETPEQRAQRLAAAKATAVARQHNDALVIGSDQVASCAGRILDKPGDATQAFEQLTWASGRPVAFQTAWNLLDAHNNRRWCGTDLTQVHFRHLGKAEIHRYLDREQAYDCAGSFKCEGLGIALFERIESLDPSALMGLPLIAVAAALREAGVAIP